MCTKCVNVFKRDKCRICSGCWEEMTEWFGPGIYYCIPCARKAWEEATARGTALSDKFTEVKKDGP